MDALDFSGAPPIRDQKCSTPFGDIDGCTLRYSTYRIIHKQCSTPFGDIDGCTGVSVVALDNFVEVLNAFRRH